MAIAALGAHGNEEIAFLYKARVEAEPSVSVGGTWSVDM